MIRLSIGILLFPFVLKIDALFQQEDDIILLQISVCMCYQSITYNVIGKQQKTELVTAIRTLGKVMHLITLVTGSKTDTMYLTGIYVVLKQR